MRQKNPAKETRPASWTVERVQTGVRLEKRLLKVLKALAELKDLTLGDLLEGMALHAFEGKAPFDKETIAQIAALKKVYGLPLGADASHRLKEKHAQRENDHE
ncbi:MAG: hypothetical protein JNL25_01815 [Rhodospirillaceae bacterium]|nr:hypothetical protein [Rhodospirillaceae bacterium]